MSERAIIGSVLDQTATLVWSTDAALTVTTVLGAGLRNTGIEVPQLVVRLEEAHRHALAGASSDFRYEIADRAYQLHIEPKRDDEGAIDGCLGIAHDITARVKAESESAWNATNDVLTSLPNRRQLRDTLASKIVGARRAGEPLSLLVIDIDSLHAVNDWAGQDAGDEVVVEVARRVRLAASIYNGYVARLGGDEFAVIINGVPHEVAEVIIHAMARPISIGASQTVVTLSIGVALLSEHGDSADHLLRAADAAVRHASSLGGGQYQISSADLTIAAADRLELEHQLRLAIERNELSLAYQPQVRLNDRTLLGVEALLRWQRDGELLTAASFIQAIEESSVIIDLGEWVINEACRQLKEWQVTGNAPPRMALNVGARHFQHAGFFETVRSALERHHIAPEMLELEITETTAMNNGAASARLIDDLRELGVEITIDDFGTGYSSLAYLKRFAVTGVKIDRSFVQDLPSRSASAIVHAILATANALGLRVVAEGVEDPEQAGFLEEAGCDEAQGYWFGRPMTAEKLAEYLVLAPR